MMTVRLSQEMHDMVTNTGEWLYLIIISGMIPLMTNYVILFVKVQKYREPQHITGIRISNYLWIPLRIMPGSRQNRRMWNLTHSLTG